jgi:hypothetical protein
MLRYWFELLQVPPEVRLHPLLHSEHSALGQTMIVGCREGQLGAGVYKLCTTDDCYSFWLDDQTEDTSSTTFYSL